jgi:hypothetical protein
MSEKPLHQLLGDLDGTSMTTTLLHGLDWIVPGEWENITTLEKVSSLSEEHLGESSRFSKIAGYLPGGIGEQKALITNNLEASRGAIEKFVADKALTRETILERIKGYVDASDAGLDTIAAILDITTNYFEHTGVQSVARRVVSRAYGEI